jgi:metal-dependent amidase/aminoacylase/carboxypeptidase family protein
VRFCIVPAEELIEVGYREELRKQGLIRYFGGKPEFLRRGLLDGCDMVFMVHTTSRESHSFTVFDGGNGCVVKNIEFRGIAAHAGGSPEKGVNALYAAQVALSAANALRETFHDDDHTRFHPIVTYGGTAVNAIPSKIVMESYVRGRSAEAILRENRKINRAMAGSAAAMGANVLLSDRPGYMPLINDPALMEIAAEAMKAVVPAENVHIRHEWETGCTDMGDISAIMPAVHPFCAGATGTGHGNDYRISDYESALGDSAKMQLILLYKLLSGDAAEAKRIIAEFKPLYSREAYFAAMDEITMDRLAVNYGDDGKITLDLS